MDNLNFKKINDLLDHWERSLEDYSMEELLRKPEIDSWSVGQVYMHLVHATLNFHLKEVRSCLSTREYQKERKNMKGLMTFHVLGSFPPIRIKVPASPQYTPREPSSKVEILSGFDKVREEIGKVLQEMMQEDRGGKSKHPGLGYLNAQDWYRLIEMHFRHHLRQRARLDAFLARGTRIRNWKLARARLRKECIGKTLVG